MNLPYVAHKTFTYVHDFTITMLLSYSSCNMPNPNVPASIIYHLHLNTAPSLKLACTDPTGDTNQFIIPMPHFVCNCNIIPGPTPALE